MAINKISCPYTETFDIDGELFSSKEIVEILGPYYSEERKAKIRNAVQGRTYSVAPVFEAPYDRGNVNAVLRSAEALGYQSAHIIELLQKFKQAKQVSQGADKWLDIAIWDSTRSCVEHLKQSGYRILVTSLDNARPIEECRFDEPAAVFFGNEHHGASDELVSMADETVILPMYGFTQSYNISVAAALTLYHIYRERKSIFSAHGDLTEEEKANLTAEFFIRGHKTSKKLLLAARRENA